MSWKLLASGVLAGGGGGWLSAQDGAKEQRGGDVPRPPPTPKGRPSGLAGSPR